MEIDGEALLAQISVGLGAIAAACDRLPDIEVAAATCNLADQLQVATEAMLHGAATPECRARVRQALGELERLLTSERRGRA